MDRYRFFQFFLISAVIYISYLAVKFELRKDKSKKNEIPVFVQSEDLATILRNMVHEESKRNEH